MTIEMLSQIINAPKLEALVQELTKAQRVFLCLRAAGASTADASRAADVSEAMVDVWKRDQPFKDLWLIAKDPHSPLTPKLLERLKIEFVREINIRAIFVLNDIVRTFYNIGYTNLNRHQLWALIKCVELGIKVMAPEMSGKQSYEEIILQLRKPVLTQRLEETKSEVVDVEVREV